MATFQTSPTLLHNCNCPAQFTAAINGAKVEALDAYMPYRQPVDDINIDDMTPEEICAYYDFEPDT